MKISERIRQEIKMSGLFLMRNDGDRKWDPETHFLRYQTHIANHFFVCFRGAQAIFIIISDV